MKKTLRILALALCLLMLSSCGLAEITDSVLNEIGSTPIVNEKITLSIGIDATSYCLDYDDNYFTHYMEEMSGVELEIVQFPEVDAETKLLLMVNGGSKLPDILAFGNKLRDQIADAGVLVALDDYFDKETGLAQQFYDACERENVDPNYVLSMIRSTDGHIYTIPNYEGSNLSGIYNTRAWINQDWLDALGLEAPKTIDELTEVLIAFRDGDPNGNGIKDEVPMSGANASDLGSNANALGWLQNMFIYRDKEDNLYLPLDQTDGKLDVSYDKEEYREYLKYVNMLVKEDLLDEAAFTQTQSELRAQLQADTQTVGMMFGSANGFGQNLASWQPLEQPVGYYGTQMVTRNMMEPSGKLMITTYCEHPEVAFLFGMMSYQYSDLTTVARYGEENVEWRRIGEDEDGGISLFHELGVKPTIQVLDDIWSHETKKMWNNVILPTISGETLKGGLAFDGNEVYGERLHARSVMMNMKYAPAAEYVVGTILYTEEEANEWAEVRTALKTYLIESSALFAVGQLDPYSDEDWNNYLNELNVLQYKDLIAVDQIAYNRTMGITE